MCKFITKENRKLLLLFINLIEKKVKILKKK